MTRIVLDQPTLTKLLQLREQLELCDESGQTLAYVTPASQRPLSARVEIPFTREELDSFKRKEGARPLAEILKDLEKLP